VDVIFALSPEGVVTSLNQGFEAMLGWPAEEWLGQPYERLIHPDDLPKARHLIAKALEGEPVPVLRLRARTASGANREVELTVTPEVRDGKVVGILGIVRDMAEQIKLEDRLRQVQKFEAMGRLAGGVAHDFNNILTAVTGYTDLMASAVPRPSQLWEDLQEIREAASRANALTRQLLAFSQQQAPVPQILDLNAVVGNLQKMLRRLLGFDVDLVFDLDETLGTIKADPGQMEQVILNLALNAREAMPDGGRLLIETRNAELDETYAQAHPRAGGGPYVRLTVRDTGLGMSPETLSQLLEPLFSTKQHNGGAGLGLALVHDIVRHSGGHITACSEPGHGSTFRLYFPPVHEPISPLRTTEPMGGTETILLAEHDPAVRGLARRVLREHGYTVLDAPDGPTAITRAKAHQGPIHLLLADVVMPGPSGPQLAGELRALRPETHVLFLSGRSDSAIPDHGVAVPGTHFLKKPFSPDGLLRKVREMLDLPTGPPSSSQ